ncbi:MAG: trypsin-like peptidase domain-containing protein [Butyrivibrio sp.]|nr:trypsin-like peptidase domain-containing protein [Butyrivibrio sp.]
MYNENDNFNVGYGMGQPEPEKSGKPRKKKNIFFKIIASVVCAVLLGGVAGVACYGVSYAGYALFPIKSAAGTDNASGAGESLAEKENPTHGNISYVESSDVKKDIKATVYDVSDIVEEVISSVVAINGTYTESVNNGFFGSQTYQSTVSGSGIIIGHNDEELLIVTNAHVIDGVEDLAVTFYDGNEAPVDVKGYKNNPDLAVLAMKLSDVPSGTKYSVATFGDSSKVRVGEAAIAVGNSMGYGISVTTGCISALDKSILVENVEYDNLIQTDAAINPGNSGGALFNAQGEVIGINSAKMTNTKVEGMGYAISISSVKDIIEELSIMEPRVQLSEDERGYLGIKGVTITEGISQTYNRPAGVEIRSVTKGSAADKAGLVQYDIIISFNGETVQTINELVEKLSYYAIGEEVVVEYYHLADDGTYEKNSTNVTLVEKPE